MKSRCDCGVEFRGEGNRCPACVAEDDRIYANDPQAVDVIAPPVFCRPVMQEQLSVTGNVDE